MHFYSTGTLSLNISVLPSVNLTMLWSVNDGTICKKYILHVSQLWKSNYNITIGAARIAIEDTLG